ncbi:MAG: nitroreductase family protein [Deltaproteobacteria bacterium]|nr:nitroreductase family protein [Deltaproteobacteria bacterium]
MDTSIKNSKVNDINTLKGLIKGRRSVRLYQPEKVSREKIMELFTIASFAPSSCNLQAWNFIVVDDEELKKRIVRKGKVNRQVLSAPTLIVAAYNRNVTREHYANYQSLAAAIQNFLLLAHADGLGTLWVCNFRDEGGIREVLDIPISHRVLAIIEVGYPKKIPKPPKRNLAENFVSFNKFSADINIPKTTFLADWRWKDVLSWQKRFASRGYPLEKITDAERAELPGLIVPHLENKRSLELYTFSAHLTSAINKHKAIIDHHFAAQEIYDAACGFESEMVERSILISDDINNEGLDRYSNYMLLNRFEHMPEDTIEAIIKNLGTAEEGKKLIILFRNRYSWFGLYDFVVRHILRKNGIDDIFFGTLRNLGPWRLCSRSWVKKIIKRHNFRIAKSYGLFCLPAYRFSNSTWVRSKKSYSIVADVFYSVLSAFEIFFKLIGLNRIIGEQILFICHLEKKIE